MTAAVALILQGILKAPPLSTANNYETITMPMFILMAEFVIISGVASDLFRAATIWVGRLRGGVIAEMGMVTPHVWAHLIVMALLAAFPGIVLWLPSTMN